MKRTIPIGWTVVPVLLAALFTSPGTAAEPLPYRPDRVIIKFKSWSTAAQRGAVLDGLGSAASRMLGPTGVQCAPVTRLSVEEAIARYRSDPSVEYVEPDYLVKVDAVPDDPDFDHLWGMRNTGQTGGTPGADVSAASAWAVTTGSFNVLVGVIDTGVDYNHPDLAANIYVNPGEIPGNNIDDDGNGFIDDVRGWDFINHDNDPYDDNGHGTHVSGTIGAVGNNGVGVAGVNWQVKILPIKFLSAGGGGYTSDAVAAVDYATRMGVRLTNNSWGGGGYSQALEEAIRAAGDAGILFVAAAGNDSENNDTYPHYPSSYDLSNIVAVAATDHNDALAGFSNIGAASVDLAAPGVNIYSTVPGGSYGSHSGTSMAAPHVAGALALMLSRFPGMTAALAKARLLAYVDTLPSLTGRVLTGGRLNAFMPIAEADSLPPAAITDLAVTLTEGSRVTLGWTATGDDEAAGAANEYDLRYSMEAIDAENFGHAARANGLLIPSAAGGPESAEIRGLAFSTPYYFAVRALDEIGNMSPISNVATTVTLGPPEVVVQSDSLLVSLFTGGTETRHFAVENHGPGELTVEVDAERAPDAGAGAAIALGSDSRARATTIVEPAGPRATGRYALARSAGHDVPLEARARPLAATAQASASAGGMRLLLLVTGTAVGQIRTGLAGLDDVAAVDLIDVGSDVPALTTLLAYDAVILILDYSPAEPDSLGNVLAEYADAGGGVVMTVASFIRGWEVRGRLLNDGYVPFELGSGPIGSAGLGSHAGHPIMRGVTSAWGNIRGDVTPAAGANLVASWDDGQPLVATRASTVVGINAFLADGGYWAGDFPLLLRNAAAWSGRRVGWMTASPGFAVVPAGRSLDVEVRFDAADLEGGDYAGRVTLRSNDPLRPEVGVPALLHVTGVADIGVLISPVEVVSQQSFSRQYASTYHRLELPSPPPAGSEFELIAEGDFGEYDEIATLIVEGVTLGRVGGKGADCMPVSGRFHVSPDQLAAFTADGRVDARVDNGSEVDPYCEPNRHTVKLCYAISVLSLEFGSPFVGQVVRRSFVVSNHGTDTLRVAEVASDLPAVHVNGDAFMLEPRASKLIDVEFQTATAGSFDGAVHILSNDPDSPDTRVPCTAAASDPPVAGADPAGIAVSLPGGTRRTERLRLSNTGASTLMYSTRCEGGAPGRGTLSRFEGLGPLVTSRVDSPRQDEVPGTRAPREPQFRRAEARFDWLQSSPVALSGVVSDPDAGLLYARASDDLAFMRYVAASDTWESLAPSLGYCGGAALLNGKIYAPSWNGTLTVYDIATDTWAEGATWPGDPCANIASDGSRYLYLAGGRTLWRCDPETGEIVSLAAPPFDFRDDGGLCVFEGALYGHAGQDGTDFARYDIAIDSWQRLAPVPGRAVHGAAVDPASREYVAYGPSGGNDLYRYAIDEGVWSVAKIPFFTINNGGLAWLPGPTAGVCLVQGTYGTGFARVESSPWFLALTPEAGEVPAGGFADLEVTFDSGVLLAGTYDAAVVIASNDPATPELRMPATLTVLGTPDIVVAGIPIRLISAAPFTESGATTTHRFPIASPPVTSGILSLEIVGGFEGPDKSATVFAEDDSIGSLGHNRISCLQAGAQFVVTLPKLAEMAEDGTVEIRVENSPEVSPGCTVNRHSLRLSYGAAAFPAEIGATFLGASRVETLSVHNRGNAVLEVTSIASDRPEFTPLVHTLRVVPRGRAGIPIRFTPSAPGAASATLTMLSNDPDQAIIAGTLRGEGTAPPVFAASPDSVLAELFTSQSVTRSLTITNMGNANLEWSLTAGRVAPSSPPDPANTWTAPPATAARGLPPALPRPLTPDLRPEWGPRVATQPSSMVGATTLLIQDFAPWDRASNEMLLAARGILFDVMLSSTLLSTDLGRYRRVIVAGDQDRNYYTRLDVAAPRINDFVAAGGVLEFHAAGWNEYDAAAMNVMLPGGMRIVRQYAEVNEVADPSHPLAAGVPLPYFCDGTSEAYFTDVPTGAARVANDEQGRPTLVVYPYGRGVVVAACQLLELYYTERSVENHNGTGTILSNMVDYLRDYAGDWLNATPLRGVVATGNRQDVTLAIGGDLTPGNYRGEVRITCNDPARDHLTIPVTLLLAGRPIAVMQDTLIDFGAPFVGDSASALVTVRNDGRDTLRVTGVVSDLAEFTVERTRFDVQPHGSLKLGVVFHPGVAGAFQATLRMECNDPGSPILTARARGTGVAPPVLAFSPDSLTADLAPGGRTTRPLTIRNDGESDLVFRLAAARAQTPADYVPYARIELAKNEADTRQGTAVEQGSGGPDRFGYAWIDSDQPGGPAFAWEEISDRGTLLPLMGDDSIAGPLPVGFPFPFYGELYDSIWVCTNGFVTFAQSIANYLNQPLPNATAPKLMLAPFWDDLKLITPRAYVFNDGNQRLIIEYLDAYCLFGGGPHTFEVILYPSGRILYQYLRMGPTNGATIGLQDATGGDGLTVAFNTAYIHDRLAVQFKAFPQWLSADTTRHTLAPGTSVTMDLGFDSRYLPDDDYRSTAIVTSNDPRVRSIEVPVWLHVRTPPSAYSIFALAGDHGTLAPPGTVGVSAGGTQAFAITPEAGCHVADVRVDGASMGPVVSYAFTDVSADHTIRAEFAVNTYTLATNIVGHGAITRTPDLARYEHATIVRLAAVAEPGWVFIGWSGDLTGAQPVDSLALTADRAVAAVFALVVAADVKPHDLNLRSKDAWLTVFLRPPAPYLPSEVDAASIRLNGAVAASGVHPPKVEEHDTRLKVKFARAEARPVIPAGDSVVVTITGTIAGDAFSAEDVIRVKGPKIRRPAGGSTLIAGAPSLIEWEVEQGAAPATASLLLSLDDGVTWQTQATVAPAGGSCSWTVPAVFSQQALLEILFVYDTDETGVIPESEIAFSEPFRIVAPTSVVTVPAVLALRPANPVVGTCLVAFSLPGFEPATLAAFDVGGRQVARRDITRSTPGWQSVDLGALHAGVYVVRLTQSGRSLTARITVIR